MGFFSNVFGTIKKAVVKAVGVVGRVLTKVAEVGEKVIKTVKAVWPKVKPWLEKLSEVIVLIPIIGPALSRAAKALLALENSPILKRVAAIAEKWLPKIKDFGEKLTKWSDIQQAKMEEQEFNQAGENLKGEELKAHHLLLLLKRYQILNSEVAKIVEEDKIYDLQGYLQVRAVSRILKHLEKNKFSKEITLDDITDDDLFVLDYSRKIVDGRMASEEESAEFDAVIEKMFGKGILAIVFDEMVKQWAFDLQVDQRTRKEMFDKWNDLDTECGDLEMTTRKTEEQNARLAKLKEECPRLRDKIDVLDKDIAHRKIYIYAAEGMLRVYEGDASLEDVVEKDLIEPIKNGIEEVAQVILDCMEHGREWETLDENEKGLLMDFANIFEKASKKRTVEVSV